MVVGGVVAPLTDTRNKITCELVWVDAGSMREYIIKGRKTTLRGHDSWIVTGDWANKS